MHKRSRRFELEWISTPYRADVNNGKRQMKGHLKNSQCHLLCAV